MFSCAVNLAVQENRKNVVPHSRAGRVATRQHRTHVAEETIQDNEEVHRTVGIADGYVVEKTFTGLKRRRKIQEPPGQ